MNDEDRRDPLTTKDLREEPYPAIDFTPARFLPRLDVNERAALRPLAFALCKGVADATEAIERFTKTKPDGFWQTVAVNMLAAAALAASGVTLLGVTAALVVCAEDADPPEPDGEEHRRESIRRARIEGAERAMAFEASGEVADPIAAVREWAATGGAS